ncbi:uncharacterized protein LOC133848362 [Drosophila sulfurigaster albostrigata]|uniref:uncharacterized protein LOC133848362 n=1 Tax=Drosophila sulfurigaster albostrigata TaxID=89887 RepID=UPI002D21BFED|nr:uncharacterized protein LOC133848362 [Drosophila sulfurigaster albostrigata]
MNSSKQTCLFYLCGLSLFCGSKDLFELQTSISVDQGPNFQGYNENFRVIIQEIPNSNFTGIRSVFQWRVGKTLNDGGINNIMMFYINDTENASTFLLGRIGIYSSGSQIGVHFTMDWPLNYPPFNCSNNFSVSSDNLACFNANYTLITNAIYFLDVEISDSIISGYISDPQDDLTNINDLNTPRNLIAEIKWLTNLGNLRPQAYSVENNYGSSCGNTSEITTFNYVPISYNNQERVINTYNSMYTVTNYICGLENTIAITD